ncbi:hypothetical protein BJP36_42005 [Moorena producens JHB]|uniref:Uncharacterized protein n=1 Tax=Moorena producens (strain JHB) TaxID=1454205 RepID=A0A9Q9SSN3_MOOP1|nr:hypothetical protein [Moorena producens]WAN68935.1 hypothetical protein BJP36_42005 [Moorena producens JHB]
MPIPQQDAHSTARCPFHLTLKIIQLLSNTFCLLLLPTPDSRLPTPDSRLPRCAFRRRIKFATGRTAPDSRLPVPYSLFPIPFALSTNAFSNERLLQVKSFAALGGVGVKCPRLSQIN